MSKFNIKFQEVVNSIRNFNQNKYKFKYPNINDFSFLLNYQIIKVKNNIIDQSIYKSNIFTGIFKQFKQIFKFKYYSCQDIFQFFPLKFKNLKKEIKYKKDLFIFKIDFNSKTQYFDCFYQLTGDKEDLKNQYVLNLFYNQIFQKNENRWIIYPC